MADLAHRALIQRDPKGSHGPNPVESLDRPLLVVAGTSQVSFENLGRPEFLPITACEGLCRCFLSAFEVAQQRWDGHGSQADPVQTFPAPVAWNALLFEHRSSNGCVSTFDSCGGLIWTRRTKLSGRGRKCVIPRENLEY